MRKPLPACRSRLHPLSNPFARTVIVAALGAAPALLGVTITEINYNPPGSGAGLEFIEIHNDSPTVVDISGWAFTEGVDFTFPKGTWIAGKGYLVICGNDAVFKAAYPNVTVAGAYVGKLDSTGETLVLSNNGGGEILRIKYRDRGKWPSIPSGTGHTLSLRRPHYDPSEPESWTASSVPGGTPGAANFSAGGASETEIIALGTSWFYKKGTEEFSNPIDAWRLNGFSTAAWLTGNTGIGYEDNDDATVLSDMRNSYLSVAMRKTFNMTQSTINATDMLVLGVNYDDGFVAYLNGTEVARPGLGGSTGTPVPYNTLATSHEAGSEEQFEIPKSLLVVGTNVLAIQAHNAALDSSDLSLAPRLMRRKLGGGSSSAVGVVFNELLGRTAGSRWVELANPTLLTVDLSGFFLSDDSETLAKYPLPPGSSLAPGGYLVVTEADSGLDFSTSEVRLFLTRPDSSATVLAEIFENTPGDGLPADRTDFSDARYPDGTGDFGFSATPTPGAANVVSVSRDIVINEIFYNPPAGNAQGEFLELHNRGSGAADLSGWAFTKGVSYTFPPGTTLAAGGYLVVAQDPVALGNAHALAGVLGPWTGTLSSSGESIRLVDSFGNTVNEVRYFDGGRWSEWADGGGSSLELIDPSQDNSFASAWAASDESSKSAWTQITYSGAYAQEAQSELHMLLLDAGAVRIDDVSIKKSGSAVEYIGNGGFEVSTAPWLIQGNHIASRRITTDAHSGSACLELTATAAGDNGVNKLDTDTAPAMTGGSYTVSFWAKWIRGVDKLLTRADSSSGASLQRVNQLTLPLALGTPGAENSARLALKAQTPSGNLGPVIGDVSQSPVAPSTANTVTVLARARDADGIGSLTIQYRTGGLGNGVFTAVSMFDDGTHADGKAADGLFGGQIPPHPAGSKVTFYIEGTDLQGNVHRFPVEAPRKRLLYAVEAPVSSPLFVSRVDLDDESESTLTTRLLHSDDLVDATFVFNDEEIYYNVGVRYHGSPWNRPPDPKMFRVRFNGDRPFIHGLKAINLSRYGSAQNEGAAYFCIQSASLPHSPSPAGDYFYTRVYHNTSFHGQMAIVETVDSRYTEKWFPGDGDGYIYKIPGRRYLNDSGGMDAVDWTTFAFRGGTAGSRDEFERYRWYFIPGSNQGENRWADLNAFCSVMDVNKTSTAAFDLAVGSILDIDQFFRVEAARVLQDDWDTIGIGNGQNSYVYFAPNEGRFKLLPWDMDHTFGNTGAKLFPEGAESQITRLVQRPQFRRMYVRITQQLLQSSWDTAYSGPFLAQTAAVMGGSGQGIVDFMNARKASVAALAPAAATFKLTRIGSTTLPANWPGVGYSAKATDRLTGTAPISVETILLQRNGQPLNISVNWTTTTWTADVPIGSDENNFEAFAFGVDGSLISSFSFKVISTSGWLAPTVASIDPAFGPVGGGTQVQISGANFRPDARVYFGLLQAASVTFVSANLVTATAPAGTAARVNVKVTNVDNQSGEKATAYEYVSPLAFVRGDVTLDGQLNIADPIRILFFLYEGTLLDCFDAADVDNSGSIDLTDVISALSYLYRGGQAPAAPFPTPGQDPVFPVDALDCSRGL